MSSEQFDNPFAELHALRAQVAALREALTPFYPHTKWLSGRLGYGDDVIIIELDGIPFTLGDFRRVIAALEMSGGTVP